MEENNEVTLLTLDDIMAVLGGFLQIVFFGAQIIAAIYNKKNGEHIIWKHCMEKYYNYENTIKNVTNNIGMQMDYHDLFLSRKEEMERNEPLDDNCNEKKHNDYYNDNNKSERNFAHNDLHDGFNCNVNSKGNFDSNNNNPANNVDEKINKNNLLMQQFKNKISNTNIIKNKNKKQSQKKFNVHDAAKANFNKNIDSISKEKGRKISHNSSNSRNKLIKEFIDEDISEEYKISEKKVSDKIILNYLYNKDNKENLEEIINEGKEEELNELNIEKEKYLIDSTNIHPNNLKNNETHLKKRTEENKNNLTTNLYLKSKQNPYFLNGSNFEGDSLIIDNKQIYYTIPGEEEGLKNPNSNDSFECIIFILNYLIYLIPSVIFKLNLINEINFE